MRPTIQDPVIIQHEEYGVGNFINATPSIVAISTKLDKKVKVHFTLPHVRELYLPPNEKFVNPFMASLEERPDEYLFGSNETNDAMPDWLHLYKKYAIGVYGCPAEPPHTWVPPYRAMYLMGLPPQPYCCIVRGARSEFWHDQKDPGHKIYKYIIGQVLEAGITPVLIGDENDKRWWFDEMLTWDSRIEDRSAGSIREAVKLIQHSDFVIANDTGLYHAAAALRKRTFVLWKFTKRIKNQAPSLDGSVAISNHRFWWEEFNGWFENITASTTSR